MNSNHYVSQMMKLDFMRKIMSVKLLVIVILVIKGYISTYCFMQGRCFIWKIFT